MSASRSTRVASMKIVRDSMSNPISPPGDQTFKSGIATRVSQIPEQTILPPSKEKVTEFGDDLCVLV